MQNYRVSWILDVILKKCLGVGTVLAVLLGMVLCISAGVTAVLYNQGGSLGSP